MVKLASSDIVAILQRFELANAGIVPRHIEQVTFYAPTPLTTLASFRYNKHVFYLLFDDNAQDDTAYVLEQIRKIFPDTIGEVLQNPNDHLTEYALTFRDKELYLFAVTSDKRRLDVVLSELHPETSRSTWQKHIKAGHVAVNNATAASPKMDVTEGDSIAVSLPDAVDYSANKLPILYIDDNVIVINKPVGILTHAKGALSEEFTVADFFRRYTAVGLDTNRPGIVHRLDRDTSGVMIGARNEETATLLQKQFADRKTKKTYLAVVDGVLKEREAKVDLPIGRNPASPSTFRVDVKGKSAITNYTVLAVENNLSLVELRPFTGRTHQLRVHMSYLGTPIHGDRVYGKKADRLYLHAQQLEITIPSGNRKIFSAPTPQEFFDKFPHNAA